MRVARGRKAIVASCADAGLVLLTARFDVREPIPFLTALCLIVTTTNSFVMPRYGYPVYALLALEAARLHSSREGKAEA